jgi:formylmethanofuran dehydrogenase subunit E
MRPAAFEATARFHGHVCPGLAIGYRMTQAALAALGAERSADEDLVAVVENDACGVDAVQYLSGCTFGKGNLIFLDVGKHAYTFYDRAGGRAVRVRTVDSPEAPQDRAARIDWLLAAPQEQVVVVESVQAPPPAPARIRASVTCAVCGERVMETRARILAGQPCCMPCASQGHGAAS